MRLTEEEYNNLTKGRVKPQSKYHNKITSIDGIKFHSKKEAEYYCELLIRERYGDVLFFLRQIPLHLPGNTKYICDFVEFLSDKSVHFIDVKGKRTPAYIKNKKMVEALYPIIIEEK